MESPYDELAEYYDAFMGFNRKDATFVLKTIKKHNPDAKKILELGCGTGAVLKRFPQSHTLEGIDISQEMLAIAQKKLPHATFHHMDMVAFNLNKKFDVILCLFDSINHLNSFEQWKKTFQNVSVHLENEGVFIFDINTSARLEHSARSPPVKIKKGNKALSMQVVKKINSFDFVLEIKKGKNNTVKKTVIPEKCYSTEKIERELKKIFSFVEKHDIFTKDIDESIGKNNTSPRRFYVCKK